MTKYQLHVLNWKDCERCYLSQRRTKVVLCRGTLPCDVLFVGESPGKSEDVLGEPFIGPSGQLLGKIVQKALSRFEFCDDCVRKKGTWNLLRDINTEDQQGSECPYCFLFGGTPRTLRVAYTNLIACIPLDDNGDKTEEPDDVCITACTPRLEEFVRIASPKLIVRVGRLSTDYLTQGFKYSVKVSKEIEFADITHPSHMLQKPIAQQSSMRQRAIIAIMMGVKRAFDLD